jgi:hypothetical protein
MRFLSMIFYGFSRSRSFSFWILLAPIREISSAPIADLTRARPLAGKRCGHRLGFG